MKKNLVYIGLAALALSMNACSNGDNEFPDFDYQTVYFANQYGLRTIELGEDINNDNSLDNAHRCAIKATWGGGYDNRNNVLIDFKVDNTLCDHLYFKGTDTPVTPMPESYYQLAGNNIQIPSGQTMGGVEVQLTDAFFADPKSVEANYVIPIRMTGQQGVDSILSGKPAFENPVLTNSSDWTVQPKNFVLYCVKYVNPFHGEYLRRGVDTGTIGGQQVNRVRHALYVEKDEVVQANTLSLKNNSMVIKVKDKDGADKQFTLKMQFADDNTCTLSSDDATVSGTGKFVSKGEKNSLGGQDRDAIYLDYSLKLTDGDIQVATKDTLVLRTRNVYGGTTFEVERR